MIRSVWLGLAFLCMGSCCPSAPPARTVPEFDSLPGAPAAGSGRIVLDVEGRRCRVRLAATHGTSSGVRITQSHHRDGEQVLCVTPCQIELNVGWHRLSFCEEHDVVIFVRRSPSVFRARLSPGCPPRLVQWPLRP